MPKQITLLRAFLASPSDMATERDSVTRIVAELNQDWKATLSLEVELVRWETHAFPGFGTDPQSVINRETSGNYEIFIGLLWTRIGTATPRAASGTLEEFKRAYSQFRQDTNSIAVMLYFKSHSVPINDIDLDQVRQIREFKSTLHDLGGLYWDFDTPENFEPLLRLHLTRVVRQWSGRLMEKRNPESGPILSVAGQTNLAKEAAGMPLHAEEDLGFLDYLELKDAAADSLTRITVRMTEATKQIGAEMLQYTKEAQSLIEAPSLDLARVFFDKTADMLDDYAAKMTFEIPRFAYAHSELIRLFSESATLSGEFGFDIEQNRSELNELTELHTALSGSQEQMKIFGNSLSKLPIMTGRMKAGRRNALNALSALDTEFDRAREHGKAVISAISDLSV